MNSETYKINIEGLGPEDNGNIELVKDGIDKCNVMVLLFGKYERVLTIMAPAEKVAEKRRIVKVTDIDSGETHIQFYYDQIVLFINKSEHSDGVDAINIVTGTNDDEFGEVQKTENVLYIRHNDETIRVTQPYPCINNVTIL